MDRQTEKTDTGRDQFKTHVANHSEATDFMCDGCGEKCNIENNIGRHGKRMHKEGSSVACPDCQKNFTEYPNIRKHIKHSHEQERFS